VRIFFEKKVSTDFGLKKQNQNQQLVRLAGG
jgi:hypothetical protein